MDTLAFADAVQTAVNMTDESDTLIVTSADHSHVFTIGGYPSRGNPILGTASLKFVYMNFSKFFSYKRPTTTTNADTLPHN